ncbi:MAG TPA: hypothetical protein PKX15_05525 [Bacteroidales bacterium]|jgi:hypothetical protein|nr:MAG: hypothetical protein BWY27_00204 [Bacteroidetes bacterium ADurb.Bin234]HOS16449.1 hypothetical protein [Bacteroidales bacterium]
MKRSNRIIVIVIITIINSGILFSCKKEDNLNKNNKISLNLDNTKLHKDATISYIQDLSDFTGINIFEFVTNPYFLQYAQFTHSLMEEYTNGNFFIFDDNGDIISDIPEMQQLETEYNNFISGIEIAYPIFITLDENIQEQILDASEDFLCYGPEPPTKGKIIFWIRIKYAYWLYDHGYINQSEFTLKYNNAVNKLNEKNGRQVLTPISTNI